jgi:hypothetical protein
MRTHSTLITLGAILLALLGACNLPGAQEEEAPDTVATWVAATLTAMGTSAPLPSSTPDPGANASATPLPPTETAQPAATPQNPLVLETVLCWQGPGNQFEVVSALKKDERVKLIGQASLPGWWIVDNPIYHDPCWAQAAYLQIEPGYNTSGLPVYTPPPTPTSTPTNTATPTATNTP